MQIIPTIKFLNYNKVSCLENVMHPRPKKVIMGRLYILEAYVMEAFL